MTVLYTAMLPAVKFGFHSVMKLHVEGKENVPSSGPLIVVANHLNTIDPPLLGVTFPRQIVFMAKDELFTFPSVLVMKALGAFSARKFGKSGMALRQALKVLAKKKVLGMFPEGKRSSDYNLARGEYGVAYVALRSGVSIIPVGIRGSECFERRISVLRRPLIGISIGKPFNFKKTGGKLNDEQLIETTDNIMRRIAQVLPHHYRGVYDDGRQKED